MKSYAALAALVAGLTDINENPNAPLFGPGNARQLVTEMRPGLVCGARGTIAATGAAVVIGGEEGDGVDVVNADLLRFDPEHIVIINETDGITFEFIKGMAAGTAIEHGIAVNGTRLTAADGITLGESKITIGTAIAAAGKTLHYFAVGR